MLINAEVFLATVVSYRLVWISGRFGGGKTSLAYRIAQEYLEKDYRLITNNKSVWADPVDSVQLDDNNHLKAVVILDEGGLWFKSSKQIEMVASYAAKMDCIYLLPSFWPPTRAAQVLVVQPVFNFKAAGIPAIFYKWRVKIGSFEDKGWFVWWRPSEIYGIYSRQDPGDTGAEIVEFLINRTNEFRQRYGRGGSDVLQTLEVTSEDVLADAVQEFAGAVDGLASIPGRKRRR
jgi:hypothetical protein